MLIKAKCKIPIVSDFKRGLKTGIVTNNKGSRGKKTRLNYILDGTIMAIRQVLQFLAIEFITYPLSG